MRMLLLTCILATACTGNVSEPNYKRDSAPWFDQKFEVCATTNENGLRPVIFEPIVEEWTYQRVVPPTIDYEMYNGGIREVVVKTPDIDMPAFHLVKQKIGFIDDNGYWVNKVGLPITDFDQIELRSGEKVKPVTARSVETLIYKSDYEREVAFAMEQIHKAEPCSVFSYGHYDKMESKITYDFESNNPFECDEALGIKRSQKFNYSEKIVRRVITRTDSSNYYVKFPNGQVQVYRAYVPIWEILNDDKGEPICEWNWPESFDGIP